MASGASVQDLYAVLGVTRSASPGTIRRAYRQRALVTHPDKGGRADAFRLVVHAFETLGSSEDRARYDSAQQGQAKVQKPSSKPEPPVRAKSQARAPRPREKVEEDDGTPCQKRRRSDPASRLTVALDALRRLLSTVGDKTFRSELLARLSHKLRQEVLNFSWFARWFERWFAQKNVHTILLFFHVQQQTGTAELHGKSSPSVSRSRRCR